MPTYGTFDIYALQDPQTKEIFYVGRSKRSQNRYIQHVREAEQYRIQTTPSIERLFGLKIAKSKLEDPNNVGKLRWINRIVDRGETPTLIVLDSWECENVTDANRLEDAWIATMRQRGEPLQNRILSRRMEPWWYSPNRKGFKAGWATSPQDYIAKLKSGQIKSRRRSGVKEKTVEIGENGLPFYTSTVDLSKRNRRKYGKRVSKPNAGSSRRSSKSSGRRTRRSK